MKVRLSRKANRSGRRLIGVRHFLPSRLTNINLLSTIMTKNSNPIDSIQWNE